MEVNNNNINNNINPSSQSLVEQSKQLDIAQQVGAINNEEENSSISLSISQANRRTDLNFNLESLNKDFVNLKKDETRFEDQQKLVEDFVKVANEAKQRGFTEDSKNQLRIIANELKESQPTGEEANNLTIEQEANNNRINNVSDTFIKAFQELGSNDANLSNTLNELTNTSNEIGRDLENNRDRQKKVFEEGRELITKESDKVENKVVHNDIKNLGQEVKDFSKHNVLSQMGHLVATQANVVQSQSVRLINT